MVARACVQWRGCWVDLFIKAKWTALADVVHGFSVTKQDIEDHFSSHASGKITEIKLMSGFGFIEYEDALDARDVVPGELPRSLYFGHEKWLT